MNTNQRQLMSAEELLQVSARRGRKTSSELGYCLTGIHSTDANFGSMVYLRYYCNSCKITFMVLQSNGDTNYCPNCGTKIRDTE